MRLDLTLTEKITFITPDPDVQKFIDLWVGLTPEEKLEVMSDSEKKMTRLLSGVDDETAERLGF